MTKKYGYSMTALKVSIAAAVLAVTLQGSTPGQIRERSHDAKVVAVERADWYQVPWSPCWSSDWYSDIRKLCNGPRWLQSDSIGSRYYQLPSQPSMNGVAPKFVYRVILRNDSENTIRTVEWDYIFIDPMTQAQVGRHHFNSEKKLRPQQRKTLVEYSSSPPTRVISVKTLLQSESNRFIEEIVIRMITYEDGSIWENRSFRK